MMENSTKNDEALCGCWRLTISLEIRQQLPQS
jgi:hypothetical protein